MSVKDLIIIGSGAAGLACAIEASRRGYDYCVIEKGCVVDAIYRFPVNMTFFTTADLLEIGDIPLVSTELKPKRADALKYYRRVVQHYKIPVRDYEKVLSVSGSEGDFQVLSRDRFEVEHHHRCRRLIVATGYYDNPNIMGIPGEGLPKVSHYFTDPHPYFGKKVVVIGGKNSAAETALELYRAGVEVTLVHRREKLGEHIKYWVLPDIQNRVDRGEIKAYFSSRVLEIRPREVLVETPEGTITLENDYVLAMTGYHPDADFMRSMGIEVNPGNLVPDHDPETLESNVKGIFLAGAIVSGRMTNRIFIENGRFHGSQMFQSWPDNPQDLRAQVASRVDAGSEMETAQDRG